MCCRQDRGTIVSSDYLGGLPGHEKSWTRPPIHLSRWKTTHKDKVSGEHQSSTEAEIGASVAEEAAPYKGSA